MLAGVETVTGKGVEKAGGGRRIPFLLRNTLFILVTFSFHVPGVSDPRPSLAPSRTPLASVIYP